MTNRLMNSGRFGYAMGFKSADVAYEALCNMINECEISECEAKIESYDAGNGGHAKRVTRWAITTAM